MRYFGRISSGLLIIHAVVIGPLRYNLGRVLLSALGIALGVALGVAVHLINHSAVNEFALAVRNLSGEADVTVHGPRSGFPEQLYVRLARLPEVRAASPALEAEVKLPGTRDTLRIVGLDPFRAKQVQPALVATLNANVPDLFAPDAILLSSAAASSLGVKGGDRFPIQVGLKPVKLHAIGILPEQAYRGPLGIMDVASAQWLLQKLGSLSRVDIRLKPGTDAQRFHSELQALLPAGVQAASPQAEGERAAFLSRPYRVNLTVLSLVALFTGAFLVFSTQALSVLRRREQLALLRVLGLTREALLWLLLGEGILMGVIGATLGLATGYAVADFVLAHLGGDLGAGYFQGPPPALRSDPWALAGFFSLGVTAALAGTLAPAWDAARSPPALALRAGDEERSFAGIRKSWPGWLLVATGVAFTSAPAVDGLPVLGYIAIACTLVGAIMLIPAVTSRALAFLPPSRFYPAQLALLQLRGAPGQASISLAAILASFSLMVAMAVMVGSFRQSLDDWLKRVLPADLYLRAAFATDSAFLTPEHQRIIAATPGIRAVNFVRYRNILLSPERPAVILIARNVAAEGRNALPVTGPQIAPKSGEPPAVWISEAVSDIYQKKAGDRLELPVGGRTLPFTVAGVWRDYARQQGAIVMDRGLYAQLTGDKLVNDAWLWLGPGRSAGDAATTLRERLGSEAGFEITEPGLIRATSLRAFDRTFAVTYGLEAAAILIGLFGISVSFSALALARRREFGMLRHVGMTRGQIGAMLASESTAVSALGVGIGLVLGLAISLILIHVVNRQSFHWSMDLHVPWVPLALLGAILVIAATLTAVWSGRSAMGKDVIRAVKEDW